MKGIIRLVMLACVGICISSSVLATNQDMLRRVEVPIYTRNHAAFLDIFVGSNGPLSMFIDTAAPGIRIHLGNVDEQNIEHTGQTNRIMYGDGNTGLMGELVTAKVAVGNMQLPGRTVFQAIQEKVCNAGYEKKCERSGSKHGGAGTIGLSIFHYASFSKKIKKPGVLLNPLITAGIGSYIVSLPRTDTETGVLVLNPTDAEKKRFTLIPLTSGSGAQIPICINQHCFQGVLDSGTSFGGNIPITTQHDMKQLGTVVNDNRIQSGENISIFLGDGADRIEVRTTASDRGEDFYHVKEENKKSGLLGMGIFRKIDVLYDYASGAIGVAVKK